MPQDAGPIAYWITFPEDPHFPLGFGVTAWCLEDAYSILDQLGYSEHRRAKRTEVQINVTPGDLDQDHVRLNSGPIVVRGFGIPFGRSVSPHNVARLTAVVRRATVWGRPSGGQRRPRPPRSIRIPEIERGRATTR